MPATGLNRYLPDWSATNAPAVNTAASATRPASTAPQFAESRHVCTSVSACLAGDTGLAAIARVQLNLRDGASGAGNILGSWVLAIPATPGFCTILSVDSLEIIGSPNTAMTLEFAAAGGAATFESVTLTGHTL
jgi:hypothetical protein